MFLDKFLLLFDVILKQYLNTIFNNQNIITI